MELISEKISASMHAMPVVEGPIPVSAASHPFCDMAHSRVPLDLVKYGYAEEEYFLSGKANVYDRREDGRLTIYCEQRPYKTRVLIRKPSDPAKFSGRVYLDILNATQLYDIEDLWHRSYLWCMENGHGYVGITSKPVCAQSLKNFDYGRYSTLDWSGTEMVPLPTPSQVPSIPGTEEGLFWDMLGQTATFIRSREDGVFGGREVEYLCLTGQSQSGCYLNTFIENFDKFLIASNGKHLFDGYLNIVGVPLMRDVRQKSFADVKNGIGLQNSMLPRTMLETKVPFIMVSSEGDLTLFRKYPATDLPVNCNTPENKCRYYEVAASPHTDTNCPILSADSEILKAGRLPQPMDEAIRRELNPMPLAYYINGFLEKLFIWKTCGEAPAVCEPIARDDKGDLCRDMNGNAVGGFRSPYVDIPCAEYNGFSNKGEGINGVKVKFSTQRMQNLYGNKENYILKFKTYTYKQAEQGWLTDYDAKRMIEAEKRDVEDF